MIKKFVFLTLLISMSLFVPVGCIKNGGQLDMSGNPMSSEIANMSFHVSGTFDKSKCPGLIHDALMGKISGVSSVNVTSSGDVLVILVGREKGDEQKITQEISDKLKTINHGVQNANFTYVSK